MPTIPPSQTGEKPNAAPQPAATTKEPERGIQRSSLVADQRARSQGEGPGPDCAGGGVSRDILDERSGATSATSGTPGCHGDTAPPLGKTGSDAPGAPVAHDKERLRVTWHGKDALPGETPPDHSKPAIPGSRQPRNPPPPAPPVKAAEPPKREWFRVWSCEELDAPGGEEAFEANAAEYRAYCARRKPLTPEQFEAELDAVRAKWHKERVAKAEAKFLADFPNAHIGHWIRLTEDLGEAKAIKAVERGWIYEDAAVREKERIAEAEAEKQAKEAAKPGVKLTRASDVEPQAIRWLWPGWLARGKLHLLAGTAGDGKTTAAVSLAAIITVGGRLPDGSTAKLGSVLMWSGEDSIEDTLLPRFIAAGGDRSKLYFVSAVQVGAESRPFDPSTDMAGLAEAARDIPDLALLIVDPVVVMVAGNSHQNTEVRRGLQPLVTLAGVLDVAALGITHFRKDSGAGGAGSVLDRVIGSMAFGAVARLVMATCRGSEPDAPRVLVRAKSNIGKDGDGFFYTLPLLPVAGVGNAQAVLWGAEAKGSAADILGRQASGDRPADAVKGWLTRLLLDDGPVPVADIKLAAEAEGFDWKAVAAAREKLGRLVSATGNARAGWVWAMVAG